MNATVICCDLQTPDQEVVSKQIVESGKKAFYYQCDVTDQVKVEKTIESIKTDVGEVSVLFHCCSLPSPRSVVNDAPPVKKTFDLTVTSYFYVSFLIFFLSVACFKQRKVRESSKMKVFVLCSASRISFQAFH